MAELYHLGVPTSAVTRLALLVDPQLESAPVVAAVSGRPLASRREYVSHLGEWAGQDVLVTTVGIGAPPLAIAVEELARAGTEAMVLLGTATLAGASTPWLLPHGAVRRDGTSAQYAPVQFPAIPDPRLRAALAEASGEAASYGIVETVDVLGHPASDHPISYQELRCAALFVVASVRGVRAAALLTDPGNAVIVARDSSTIHDMTVAACRALTASMSS